MAANWRPAAALARPNAAAIAAAAAAALVFAATGAEASGLGTPCVPVERTLTTALAARHCGGKSPARAADLGSAPERGPLGAGCNASDTAGVQLALANGIFSDCQSVCLYSVESPGSVAFEWLPEEQCWSRQQAADAAGLWGCLARSAEREAAARKVEHLCRPSPEEATTAALRGAQERRAAREETKFITHFMPWFENATRQQGNHWCDPYDGNSYYDSVFGRYTSSDPSIIRKQLEMMKAAGLDGLWIDLQLMEWLPTIRRVVEVATEMGLNFAIVADNYADANIANSMRRELQDFMMMPNYYRVFGRPVLPFFEHPERQGITKLPNWRGRDGRPPYVIGTYSAHADEDKRLPEGYESLFFWHSPDLHWLERYYESDRFPVKVGSIFRGWREAYAIKRHTPPYLGYLESTLAMAKEKKPFFAQLVTWNDYTEGTMLEPSFLRSGPAGCADPTRSYWHNKRMTCAELFSGHEFSDGGAIKPCSEDSWGDKCSGSGGHPCALVRDCSKPVGATEGLGRPECAPVERSAYADLAAVAHVLTGLPRANATAAFKAILLSPDPQPTPDPVAGAPPRQLPLGVVMGVVVAALVAVDFGRVV